MKTLEEAKIEYIDDYKIKLQSLLEGLDQAYRPSANRIEEIIENSAANLNIDDLLVSRFIGSTNMHLFGIFPNIPLPQFPPAPHLPPLPPLPNLGREWCILKNIAIGAAILAAWVASGGTLIIGTSIAGVTVTSEIVAALIGGASGRVIAEKLCS